MSHFKRKKCRRQVRCTICTKTRWLGNSGDRTKISDQRRMLP